MNINIGVTVVSHTGGLIYKMVVSYTNCCPFRTKNE